MTYAEQMGTTGVFLAHGSGQIYFYFNASVLQGAAGTFNLTFDGQDYVVPCDYGVSVPGPVLVEGESYNYSASGTITNIAEEDCDPDGVVGEDPHTDADESYAFPGLKRYSLIGADGDPNTVNPNKNLKHGLNDKNTRNLKATPIAGDGTWVAPFTGTVFFYVNDIDLTDNDGTLNVFFDGQVYELDTSNILGVEGPEVVEGQSYDFSVSGTYTYNENEDEADSEGAIPEHFGASPTFPAPTIEQYSVFASPIDIARPPATILPSVPEIVSARYSRQTETLKITARCPTGKVDEYSCELTDPESTDLPVRRSYDGRFSYIDLTVEGTYTYVVTAYNAAGNTSTSTQTVVVGFSPVPDAPKIEKCVYNKSNNSIFTVLQDGVVGAVGYKYYVILSTGKAICYEETTAISSFILNAEPKTMYEIYATAINLSGESAKSNIVKCFVPDTIPGQLIGVFKTAVFSRLSSPSGFSTGGIRTPRLLTKGKSLSPSVFQTVNLAKAKPLVGAKSVSDLAATGGMRDGNIFIRVLGRPVSVNNP